VVLPALNEAAALPVAFASVPAQADLVVVDNGSSDATTRWMAPADPGRRRAVTRTTAITSPPGPSIPGRGAWAH